MTIEPLSADTVADVAALERLCFSLPWSLSALEGELRNPLAVWLVAKIDDEVAGYAGMHRVLDEACVTNVAVAPARRKAGIARALLLALEGICRREGAAFLTLEVRPSNQTAISLYKGLGFEEAGRRRDYYSHPAEDALLLTKFFAGEATL